jgi:glycosyltransferase involved in cell wall biosynthesis
MESSSEDQGLQSRRKKIAWVSFIVFDFCNIVSQTQMLNQMSKRGYEVYLFAMRSKKRFCLSDSEVHLLLTPLRHIPIISSSLYVFVTLLSLPFYIAAKGFDYVVFEPGTSLVGLVLGPLLRLTGTKVILDIRSTPLRFTHDFREDLHQLLFRTSVIIAKKRFQGMTILTRLMKMQVCSEFDLSSSFVGVWTSGVSGQVFDPTRYNGEESKRRLGLEHKFVIFHHGVLGKTRANEGLVGTIGAFSILKNRLDDLVLFLLGEGEGVSVLEKVRKEKGLENIVMFHSRVDYVEVPKFIAMSDVAVVPLANSPNWRYQCPLKLLEYLAMEKVVIVTDIPAHREVIGKSRSGIYVKSTDPEEIAKAITFAYANRDRLGEWGKAGRNIIESAYTWEKVAEEFDNFISAI